MCAPSSCSVWFGTHARTHVAGVKTNCAPIRSDSTLQGPLCCTSRGCEPRLGDMRNKLVGRWGSCWCTWSLQLQLQQGQTLTCRGGVSGGEGGPERKVLKLELRRSCAPPVPRPCAKCFSPGSRGVAGHSMRWGSSSLRPVCQVRQGGLPRMCGVGVHAAASRDVTSCPGQPRSRRAPQGPAATTSPPLWERDEW